MRLRRSASYVYMDILTRLSNKVHPAKPWRSGADFIGKFQEVLYNVERPHLPGEKGGKGLNDMDTIEMDMKTRGCFFSGSSQETFAAVCTLLLGLNQVAIQKGFKTVMSPTQDNRFFVSLIDETRDDFVTEIMLRGTTRQVDTLRQLIHVLIRTS